jgi:glucose-1-phosphate thymidylyltransferase
MAFNYLEGWWTDAGTFDSLLRAANLVHDTNSNLNRHPVLAEVEGE